MNDIERYSRRLLRENQELQRKIGVLERRMNVSPVYDNAFRMDSDRYRVFFATAQDAMFIIHGEHIVECNHMACELFDCEPGQHLSLVDDASETLLPCGIETVTLLRAHLQAAWRGEAPCFEWEYRRRDGSFFEADVCINRMDLAEGPVLLAIARDISARKKVERKLRASEERYRIVADYAFAWEMWLSPQGEIRYVSPSCEIITGRPLLFFQQHGLQAVRACVHKDDRGAWDLHMHEATKGEAPPLDVRIQARDGEDRWVCQVSRAVVGDDGRPLGVRVSIQDVTARRCMEEQLRHESLHDSLTGLPNRTLCLDRIAHVLERSKRRNNYHYAVLLIELDRYAQISESLGHRSGDKLLVSAAGRIAHVVRSIDTVSRFGGESFVVLLDELDSPREAVKVAKRIRDAMQSPFRLNEHEAHTGVSVGIVLSPAVYRQPEDLLQNAAVAMRHAQKLGRNRLKVFTGKLLEVAMQTLSLESDLRRAIRNNEFFLVYQPIYSLSNKQLSGFEALVRWQHPARGLLSPAAFIPVAEHSGLIVELGDWVLEQACKTLRQWSQHGVLEKGVSISVNLSPRQLSHPSLLERVAALLRQYAIERGQLKLEITETTIMEDADRAAEKLTKLREMGVQLSIDDFGTGYSSMNQLGRFPLDNLKIDLSFVQQMHKAPENLEIVRAIVALAHNLGLEVVAEGIEADDQHGELCTLNCEYGQGFLFSRPVDEKQALAILQSGGKS